MLKRRSLAILHEATVAPSGYISLSVLSWSEKKKQNNKKPIFLSLPLYLLCNQMDGKLVGK